VSETNGMTRGETERADGRVLLATRPHPITIVIRSLTAVVLLIVYALFLMDLVRRAGGPVVAGWLLWAAVAVAGLRVLVEVVRWFARRYTLTPTTISATDGVLRRWRVEMPLERIQHAVLHQTILERVLGLGTVGVSSAGGPGLEVLWLWIERPRAALAVIEAVRERRAGRGDAVGSGGVQGVTNGAGAPEADRRAAVGSGVPPIAASGDRYEGREEGDGHRGVNSADREEPRSVAPSASGTTRPGGRPGVDRSLVIGLVGGIGAGKSAVARALEELGAAVSDSDRQARAMLTREDVRRELVSWWGDRVLTPEGGVDRGRVAAIVFADSEQRRRLEGLIHPMLRAGREELKREAWENGIGVVVIDAPLLFEAGIQGECDEVWFVDTPREVRLGRVLASRGWDEGELARREAAQMAVEEKRRRATRVIPNDGDEADLRHHAREALEGARGA